MTSIRTQCRHCKKTFDARRLDAIYCGPSCRSAAAKERRQKRTKARHGASGRSYALASALSRAITKTAKTPADGAAVALARLYARMIDADPTMAKELGPRLLEVLVQLGMTPRARAGAFRSEPVGFGPARAALDELRARRLR